MDYSSWFDQFFEKSWTIVHGFDQNNVNFESYNHGVSLFSPRRPTTIVHGLYQIFEEILDYSRYTETIVHGFH